MAKLTQIENAAKNLLEKSGVEVFKGSYPDFVVYDPETDRYCLVEVKSKNDKLSLKQKRTLAILKKLGIRCYILHSDSVRDLLDIENAFGISRERQQDKYLTKKERKYFDALANFNTIKAAAASLGIANSTLYNWKCELKKRYKRRRGWINSVLSQTRRGGNLADLLTERKQMSEPDSEEDDELE